MQAQSSNLLHMDRMNYRDEFLKFWDIFSYSAWKESFGYVTWISVKLQNFYS